MKKRILLTDHHVRIVVKDLREFGYNVTFDEVRKIADQIADGTYKQDDPVAMIIVRQIDEAMEMRRN